MGCALGSTGASSVWVGASLLSAAIVAGASGSAGWAPNSVYAPVPTNTASAHVSTSVAGRAFFERTVICFVRKGVRRFVI